MSRSSSSNASDPLKLALALKPSDPLELTLALPARDSLELALPHPHPAPVPVPLELALALHAAVRGPKAVNLDLTLAPPARVEPFDNERWDIVKTLTDSDIGYGSRLLLPKNKANDRIMQNLSIEEQRQVRSPAGLLVKVLDVDTNREVIVTFKVLPSSQVYILNGQWIKEFVKPRGLLRNHVIGLRYLKKPGDEEGKILFKVLRAVKTPPESTRVAIC